MRRKIRKLAEGRSSVSVLTNRGQVVGVVNVDKDSKMVLDYLDSSDGNDNKEYMNLLERCRLIEFNVGIFSRKWISKRRIRKEDNRVPSVSELVRDGLKNGLELPSDLVLYVKERLPTCNVDTIHPIIWKERKNVGLGAFRPKGGKR